MEMKAAFARARVAKAVLLMGLMGLLLTYFFVLRQQLDLSAWHKQWRLHREAPPAVWRLWAEYNPNVLELRTSIAVDRMQKKQPQDEQEVARWLHRMKTIRPGWPYYLLLEQQWRLAMGRLDPKAWVYVLRKGVYEPEIAQAVGLVLFQNWAAFKPEQRREMLALLWGAGPRVQGRLINAAFLSSRLFEYCDYGYNTALDMPPECRKAGWRPLE